MYGLKKKHNFLEELRKYRNVGNKLKAIYNYCYFPLSKKEIAKLKFECSSEYFSFVSDKLAYQGEVKEIEIAANRISFSNNNRSLVLVVK